MASGRNLQESRKDLLKARGKASPRNSLDEAYLSSTDDDEEFGELEPLENNGNSLGESGALRRHHRVESGALLGTSKTNIYQGSERPLVLRGLRKRLRPRLTCIIISAILLGGLSLLLGGGGVWVYKTAPKDGVC